MHLISVKKTVLGTIWCLTCFTLNICYVLRTLYLCTLYLLSKSVSAGKRYYYTKNYDSQMAEIWKANSKTKHAPFIDVFITHPNIKEGAL